MCFNISETLTEMAADCTTSLCKLVSVQVYCVIAYVLGGPCCPGALCPAWPPCCCPGAAGAPGGPCGLSPPGLYLGGGALFLRSLTDRTLTTLEWIAAETL